MLNWNDYRYLLAVEAHGSLVAAARRLGVSQPTVGRRLAALSEALGVDLLDIQSDGARLSEAGRRVCEQARVLEQQAALIEFSARERKESDAARLKLAVSEGFAHVVLLPILAGFRSANPHIDIDLIVGTRVSDLRHSEADVAIRVGDPSDDYLRGRTIGKVDFGLYAHEEYLANAGPVASVSDLNTHMIIESTGEIANLPQAKWLRTSAPRARVAFSSNSALNQIDAMVEALGILALPNYRAAGLVGIRRLLVEEFRMRNDVWLLYHPKAKESTAVRTMVDYFAREVPKKLKVLKS